jgi:endo-1,4-beta-xylanase
MTTPRQSLGEISRSRGLYFGSAVRLDELAAEQDLREAVFRECSLLVPELTLKWAAIEPARGELVFADVDDLSSLARRNGKVVRGHTLLWHESVPAWAPALLKEPDGWQLISRYFSSVIPRFGDVIQQWDVVNEPIDVRSGRADGLRANVFLQSFGPDYVARALREARIFAPGAQLTINEYGLEYDLEEERGRRRALLNLVGSLKKTGAPIAGLGLQSHLDLRKGSVSSTSIRQFLKEVLDLGLFVYVSELDVKESDYTQPPEERDRLVADEVRRYLDTVLAFDRVVGVSTWGLSDRHSWLGVTAEDYARFPNAWRGTSGPGLNRGLPFDAAMRPKPMYFAIAAALIARHRR